MQNKLLQIIHYYGIKKQLKYIHSEYYELDEAILKSYDTMYDYEIEHIAEEIADIQVMLKQIQYYYEITDEDIEKIMQYKTDRQIERIKNERKNK